MSGFTLATARDYTDRYGPLDAAETAATGAHLARASRIVRDEFAREGFDITVLIQAGKVQADTAADVVCDMVAYMQRSAAGDAPFGATQVSQTAGPYTQSASYKTPTGSMSFTRVHRRRLGLPVSRAFNVDLLAGRS
jgi:phage protein gp19/gp15/gp42